MLVKNLDKLAHGKIAKITQKAYAICTKDTDKEKVIKLYSYDTLICAYEYDKEFMFDTLYFTAYYDYSVTTIKHLHDFLKSVNVDLPIPVMRKEFANACSNWFEKNGTVYKLCNYPFVDEKI